jgi:hypothetical protein
MVMNMKKIITWVVLIALTTLVSIIAVLLRKNPHEMNPEISAAVAEFKANPGFRQKVANKVLPHVKAGMTQQEVKCILGKPDQIQKSAEGVRWQYSLFYSMFIDIQFNHEGTLIGLDACADAATDTRAEGSGVYHVGPQGD